MSQYAFGFEDEEEVLSSSDSPEVENGFDGKPADHGLEF